ncbi:pyridoxal-dependent decarboxylase [Mycobacterium sp. 050128]|uniref:pyridoxal phosphate-dependent decarboxylase family protein n=1 Tax=unclassified Mycobacterium TaxID=2642494 RepID=UPI002ED869AA
MASHIERRLCHRGSRRQRHLPGRSPPRDAGPGRLGRGKGALIGAPPLRILCGEHANPAIDTALRLLGLGANTPLRIGTDDQGRTKPEALVDALAQAEEPTIVCAQAGNVATGAFDAFEPIADACTTHNAWLHIDGAFGPWAAAARATQHLTRCVQRADSWAVDAHKWLNVPHDAGMAIVADAEAHVAAMRLADGRYYVIDSGQRDNTNYVAESSRRARAVPIYAAIRSPGRAGVAELIERNCAQARRMAKRLAAIPGAVDCQRRRPQPSAGATSRRR